MASPHGPHRVGTGRRPPQPDRHMKHTTDRQTPSMRRGTAAASRSPAHCRRPTRDPAAVVAVACIAFIACAAAGCGGPPTLMPTPSIYTRGDIKPLDDVPPSLQNNKVDVLYVTDRVPETSEDPALKAKGALYGSKRSRSAAYGLSEVQIGPDSLTWAQWVKASETAKRDEPLELKVVKSTELGRFPPTPKVLAELPPRAVQIDPANPSTLPATTRPTTLTTAQSELKAEVEQE